MSKKNNTAEKSILEAEKLSDALKEGTKNSLKDIMNEAINKLIAESDNDDENSYEEEDVDTEETPKDDDAQCKDGKCPCEDGECEKGTENGDDDEWSDMEQYKVGDNDYDFTGVDGDEILKVYNKLGDDDQIFVKKDEDGNYDVKDEETGAEYVIELNADGNDESGIGTDDFDSDDDEGEDIELDLDSDDNEGDDDIEIDLESDDDDDDDDVEFEFGNDEDDDDEMLNEENLGYTNNYQKDVMPGLNMNEPANSKATYSMDAGAPKGNSRPYSGYKKKDGDPFTNSVNEEMDECGDMGSMDGSASTNMQMPSEPAIQEAGHNVGGFVQQRTASISQGTNSGEGTGRQSNIRNRRVAGDVKNGTDRPISEAFVRNLVNKAKEIQNENKKYAKALENIKESVGKAALLNVNLSQIVKLLSENTTNASEKKSIIDRFTNVKTIRESKNLYDTIKRELNESTKSSVVLERQISADGSSKMLNETTMYQRNSNPALNLMDRLENLYK